jgi:dienelactone hydrolase
MASDLAKALGALDTAALSPEEHARWSTMLADDAAARLREANRRDAQAWAKVQSKADWEHFREARLRALRDSLGRYPAAPPAIRAEVTGTLDGEGLRIEKLVFESRPGLVATANLYRPEPARPKMPGILLCHSHHNPKTEGELQDMGAAWARAGCLVLVMDQIGHGERRQQPFGGRQDYRSRFYTGMQLHLIGDSLMGWMAWDLARGVDLLLARPGIDRQRIIAIGSVAGGGDPAAVAVALDPRIAGSVPFNFGGPEPETRYPLPPDSEQTFNYAGSGSFESTRNLRASARDGFLPYVIVGAAAPRPLVYAHEFAWDGQRDPVWKRLERIYEFYGARDRLAAVHGRGNVNLRPPEATHCNNVGPEHRKELYPYLERWFGIPAPKEESRQRRKPEELACLTEDARAKFQSKPVHDLARALGAERAAAARAAAERLDPPERRLKLRDDWARLLGDVEPKAVPQARRRDKRDIPGATVERFVLQVEERIVVPAIVLMPPGGSQRPPLVVGVAEEGKQALLKHRADEVAALLKAGIAVCLPDLRGTGETDPNGDPGRFKKTTDASSTDLMLGQTMLGSRLRDLRAVLRYLRTRGDIDAARVALWGDAVSPVNEAPFEDQPESADVWPHEVKPMGSLVALLGALFEDGVRAVLARRGLVAWEATLGSHFCYIPHDTIVPGAMTAGDLSDVAGALAPRPLRLEGPVDGRCRPVAAPDLRRWLEPTERAYARESERLVITPAVGGNAAAWLAAALKK